MTYLVYKIIIITITSVYTLHMLNKVVVIFKKIFCFIDKLTPLNYLP